MILSTANRRREGAKPLTDIIDRIILLVSVFNGNNASYLTVLVLERCGFPLAE